MVQEINNVEINKLVNQIIHEFPAKEIFLFGSYAVGNFKEESDIDLCIITDKEARKIDLLKQVRRVIAPVVTKPVDLLVYKEDEFYERAGLNTTFEYKIKNEGIKIYEKS
jgi:predicted nucleotidyltransferase